MKETCLKPAHELVFASHAGVFVFVFVFVFGVGGACCAVIAFACALRCVDEGRFDSFDADRVVDEAVRSGKPDGEVTRISRNHFEGSVVR